MEADQAPIQPQVPRIEYVAIEDGESSALDDVFNTLFELVDKISSKD